MSQNLNKKQEVKSSLLDSASSPVIAVVGRAREAMENYSNQEEIADKEVKQK